MELISRRTSKQEGLGKGRGRQSDLVCLLHREGHQIFIEKHPPPSILFVVRSMPLWCTGNCRLP